MKIATRVIKHFEPNEIIKQVNFGTAKGLTETAKQGQSAVVDALKSTFTLRGNWFAPTMRYGIRITPARKDKLQSEVKTAADWLEPHETGKDKSGRAGRLSVPTENVRRSKKMIIPRAQRPKGLADKAFILKTKHGEVLAVRQGRGKTKKLVVLYGLEKTVKIKKQSTFYAPIQKVVDSKLKKNIMDGIRFAFATRK
jgi:hypothetical protein